MPSNSRAFSPLNLWPLLQPSRVRNGLMRRWFEHRLQRTALSNAPGLTDIGSEYGGWVVPHPLIGRGWVCYCVGIGGDTSFDRGLVDRYDATVRAFDPVDTYVDAANESFKDEPRFSAYQAGIAVKDGPIRMQVTHDPVSRSVSSAGLYRSRDFVELPGRTIGSLMNELGDRHIDLLKLDIEGAEYDVVPNLDLEGLDVKIFLTQLHHTGSVKDARALIENLRLAGYVAVGCRSTVKLTFARHDLL